MPINILGITVLWAILIKQSQVTSAVFSTYKMIFVFFHAWVGEFLIVLQVQPSVLNPTAELGDDMIFIICMETFMCVFYSC